VGHIFEYSEHSDIHVESCDTPGMREIIYDKNTGLTKEIHRGVFKRIRYFSGSDLDRVYGKGCSDEYNNRRFSVLFDGDKIIGICKAQYYPYNNENIKDCNHIIISFFSIDRYYRGKKYSKLMIQEMVAICKKDGFSLGSSSWTHLGNKYIRSNIKAECERIGVKFYDNDNMFDNEDQYYDGIHRGELTDSERIKYGLDI
jgi:hypothetical protein